MKAKILSVLILFCIFILFLILKLNLDKPSEYKVLKVIRADLFYVDINKNNKIDDNELFKLKDIYAFSPELNNFTISNAKKLNLDKIQYLKTGFLAQNWAIDNLEGKNIVIKSITEDKTKNYKYIKADFLGSDLAKTYLENGLAYVLKENNSNYIMYQNLNQAKLNSKEISKLNFVLLNLNSNIYHKLNCEFVDILRRAKLILLRDTKNFIPCKSCHNVSNIKIPDIPSSIQNKKEYFIKTEGIELYLTNPNLYNKPDNACSNLACQRLVQEINNTKISLDIALYGIGDIPLVYGAIKNAKNRGVKVRAVVDYSKKMDELYPKTRNFINDFDAHFDNSEIIMHNKFFIFDGKSVMTGSANISPSGIGGYSANSILFINSKIIAKRYEQEFEELYHGRFSKSKNKFEIVSDNGIAPYFSPVDDVKSVLIKEIKSAKDKICISAFI